MLFLYASDRGFPRHLEWVTKPPNLDFLESRRLQTQLQMQPQSSPHTRLPADEAVWAGVTQGGAGGSYRTHLKELQNQAIHS